MNIKVQQASRNPEEEKKKVSFWRKVGGGSLTISLIIHAIILAIGVYIVVQVIPPTPDPAVDFLPKGGGGGASPATPSQKVRVQLPPNSASRISAKGATSSFSLPEPDTTSAMTSLNSLDSGSLSGGMGGKGSGGGKGDGQGLGIGDGMGIGIGGNSATSNPFGAIDIKADGLNGVLYDLKQTKFRKEIGDQNNNSKESAEFRIILKEFIDKNWNERLLDKYYRAEQELKQTRIMIPRMDAADAPKAFRCENEVQPKRWLVIYRGNVVAPKTGKFRFVGMGDDVLLVRFNKKLVFDFGYTFASFALDRGREKQACAVITDNVKGTPRDFPLQWPLQMREYPGLGGYNAALGGLAVGADFQVQEGATYPIEILLSEIPGGAFSAVLLIEEDGASYQKTSTGLPIIPIFRTNIDLPSKSPSLPPFDSNSPIWKTVSGAAKIDI